jgi:hypothetical protein
VTDHTPLRRTRPPSTSRSPSHLWALVLLSVLVGCTTPTTRDDSALLEHMPRSILVLPPLDLSLEPAACYGTLAKISRPLAERGFYVFPVAVVDMMMRDNGLPTPLDMHAVPLDKLVQVFDPDAVLYLTVHDWGTRYQVVASTTSVTLEARLVDAETGIDLWHSTHTASRSSGGGGGSLAGLLIDAVVNQVGTALSDPTPELAREASWGLFASSDDGLLLGPLHPDHVPTGR